jgi:hypothetical protein
VHGQRSHGSKHGTITKKSTILSIFLLFDGAWLGSVDHGSVSYGAMEMGYFVN